MQRDNGTLLSSKMQQALYERPKRAVEGSMTTMSEFGPNRREKQGLY